MKSFLITAGLGLCVFSPLVALAEGTPTTPPGIQISADVLDTLGNQYVNSALWQQYAAERKALCYQTYQSAWHIISERATTGPYIKRDGKLYEYIITHDNEGKYIRRSRPLAVILDLDETVFDSVVYESWKTLHTAADNSVNYKKYVEYQAQQEHPDLVPGVSRFLKQCKELGITPIYITDRDTDTFREQCLRTLRHAGLDTPTLEQELFCRDKERDKAEAERIIADMKLAPDDPIAKELLSNASHKVARRWYVGSRYKVMATFGDDLHDHPLHIEKVDNPNDMRALREQVVHDHSNRFGYDVFLLPNPIYGNWRNQCGLDINDPETPIKLLRQGCAPFDNWLKEQESKDSK